MAASSQRQRLLQEMYAAHWALARAMMASRGSFIQECGLNRSQAEALFVIHYRECKTIGQLASILGVTSGAATQTVETLEKQGLVTRQRQTDDRRVVHIVFTEAGMKMLKRLSEYQFKRLEQLMESLTDHE